LAPSRSATWNTGSTSRLIRVHHRHSVALDHIQSLKKLGDGGIAQLAPPTR
jgi:hypothetical protein